MPAVFCRCVLRDAHFSVRLLRNCDYIVIMSAQTLPLRRPLLAFANAFDPKPVTGIFACGVAVWVVATFLLGYKPGQDTPSYAILEAFETAWQKAFLWGLGAVILLSLIYSLRRKRTLLAVLVNSVVFASPFALFLIGVWTLDAVYLEHPATLEVVKLFGPILMLFYIFGIFYMGWRAPKGKDEALPAFMLSSFTAVILVLAFTGFKLFTSTEYIYRDAFGFIIESVQRQGDQVEVIGTLVINREGPYQFTAISNDFAMDLDDRRNSPVVEFPKHQASPSEQGRYPVRIVYTSPKSNREARMDPARPDTLTPFEFGPEVYLQVNLPAENGNPPVFVKSIPLWVQEFIDFPPRNDAPSTTQEG